jgi:hypothetical protein
LGGKQSVQGSLHKRLLKAACSPLCPSSPAAPHKASHSCRPPCLSHLLQGPRYPPSSLAHSLCGRSGAPPACGSARRPLRRRWRRARCVWVLGVGARVCGGGGWWRVGVDGWQEPAGQGAGRFWWKSGGWTACECALHWWRHGSFWCVPRGGERALFRLAVPAPTIVHAAHLPPLPAPPPPPNTHTLATRRCPECWPSPGATAAAAPASRPT